uniref:RWD domain-containing protein n=1 Tax=Periophthalmus magnuspinnatus TaxID=409849 RepID=A0A3B4AVC7_9GOBI
MSYLDWAESQLAEIELLSSMFSTREELEFSDPFALALLRSYVEGTASKDVPPTSRPHFLIKQKIQPIDVIVSCTYPSEYPSVLPEITVRYGLVNRSQQSQLHLDLSAHLSETCLGEVCVLSAVDWLKDHLHLYTSASSTPAPNQRAPPPAQNPEVFTRLWIYSHHIYNKVKRKSIMEWSKELGLTGFSMPGKPGVVCVEGSRAACENFWARYLVKVLTWKKIMIRHREDIPLIAQEKDNRPARTLDSLRKFSHFEEAMFDPHGNRGNHMDLGQLYQFLNEKGLSDVFQLYFGIEGR